MYGEARPSFDVTVVGAGVAGLMLTKKLSELGLRTALVEQADVLAVGPSTRNEGWLHRGTYHATSIDNRENAIQVARRCIYGHEQIKSFAPEAIEDIDLPSFALVRNPERVEQIVSRWDEAGVFYRKILLRDLARLEPNVKTDAVAEAFQVQDLGINTRLLYRKLFSASKNAGALVLTGTEIAFSGSEQQAKLKKDEESWSIESKLFVHTSGYGVKKLFESNFGIPMPLRYWKSHLMVLPRLTKSSVFCLDPHEAAMMNHGESSIVGLNEDAFVCDTPDYETIQLGVDNIRQATRRLFYEVDEKRSLPVACIKTDLVEKSASARSLNISVSEPIANHICVLPGKMTEAPYVTDMVTKMVYDRINDNIVALRPMDSIKEEN